MQQPLQGEVERDRQRVLQQRVPDDGADRQLDADEETDASHVADDLVRGVPVGDRRLGAPLLRGDAEARALRGSSAMRPAYRPRTDSVGLDQAPGRCDRTANQLPSR